MRTPTAARLLLLSLLAGGGILGCSGKDAGKEHAFTNRLAKEKSPYLLQHAHNPVDWYPWGPEALEKARKEDKPIFLSVGYSTCHWCHVMERECFEDETVAAVLNEYFVPIKVDREERPDIDHLYMSAVQAMNNGQGGWPMSVFLTPDLKPFFAGTYFPPDRPGRPGFRTLLENLHAAWTEQRADIEEQGNRVAEFLRSQATAAPVDSAGLPVDESILREGYEQLHARYDSVGGGFGGAPKFPSPHTLSFLFRYSERTGNRDALDMARGTLDAMAAGGIHDHLGGGFHRYATDIAWLVPHFEKMLYDQAGLVLAYLDGWLVLGDPNYEMVVRDVCDYVIRDLGHPGGGYYAAEDADSEGEEGKFYVWSSTEIDSVLGDELGPAFRSRYRSPQRGNWEGKNILHLEALAPGILDEFTEERTVLFEERESRVRPHRDEKIITAWNGFMIEAMARAGAALDEPRYLASAVESADFVLANLVRDDRVLRHWQDGAADVPGYLDDYAFLGRGLLALYEATFDPRWLAESIRLAESMEGRFARPETGTYTLNAGDGEELLAPVVEIHDGAMPSANAAAAMLLLRLGHLTARPEMEEAGWGVIETLAPQARQAPTAFLALLCALDFRLGPDTEIVVAGETGDAAVGAMWRAVRDRYLPNAVSAFRPEKEKDAEAIVRWIPYLEEQTALDGRATAYVCRGYACRLPVHTAEELGAELDAGRAPRTEEE